MKKTFRVQGLNEYDLEGPIDQVIRRLQKFQNKHPTATLSLDAEEYYGAVSVDLKVYEERKETEEERQKRETDEKAMAAYREKREREAYEALKEKFGD